MPDREKVIKGLEHCRGRDYSCEGCPYATERHRSVEECLWARVNDAIALLKEQPEIVLCKDCKHLGTNDCTMYNHWGDDEPTPGDYYCAVGERR